MDWIVLPDQFLCVCFASLLQLLLNCHSEFGIEIGTGTGIHRFQQNQEMKRKNDWRMNENRRMKWLKKEMKREILGAFECCVCMYVKCEFTCVATAQWEMLFYLILGNLMWVLSETIRALCLRWSSCPYIFETVESHVCSCTLVGQFVVVCLAQNHITIKQSERSDTCVQNVKIGMHANESIVMQYISY